MMLILAQQGPVALISLIIATGARSPCCTNISYTGAHGPWMLIIVPEGPMPLCSYYLQPRGPMAPGIANSSYTRGCSPFAANISKIGPLLGQGPYVCR